MTTPAQLTAALEAYRKWIGNADLAYWVNRYAQLHSNAMVEAIQAASAVPLDSALKRIDRSDPEGGIPGRQL